MFFHPFIISIIIILLTHPTQIIRSVVSGIPVDMVRGSLVLWVIVRAERGRHKAAD